MNRRETIALLGGAAAWPLVARAAAGARAAGRRVDEFGSAPAACKQN
jgi:hypothetical protein